MLIAINMKDVIALLMILATFAWSMSACNTHEELNVETPVKKSISMYPPEVQNAINTIYDACLMTYGDVIPKSIINDKIETIRFCDILDYSGDILLEMDGYELIEDILWPNGYGNPL